MGEDGKPDPTPPAAAPAAAPAPESVEDDYDAMTMEELEALVENSVKRGVEAATPKAPAEDPNADLDPRVREIDARTKKVEEELAARRANEQKALEAQQEAARITAIQKTAQEFKMTKEELLAVADYADAHPDKAAVADFRTLAIMQNPELLLRAKATPTPEPKPPAAPDGGPAPAAIVEVGSGGDAPPAEFTPGAGHGFGDITRWALRHQAGQFIQET